MRTKNIISPHVNPFSRQRHFQLRGTESLGDVSYWSSGRTRLRKDPEKAKVYEAELQTLLKSGYFIKVPPETLLKSGYFIKVPPENPDSYHITLYAVVAKTDWYFNFNSFEHQIIPLISNCFLFSALVTHW